MPLCSSRRQLLALHSPAILKQPCPYPRCPSTSTSQLAPPAPACIISTSPPPPPFPVSQECDALKSTFAGLGSSSAYVLGDGLNGLQWHVFVAGTENAHATAEKPLYTLEVRCEWPL